MIEAAVAQIARNMLFVLIERTAFGECSVVDAQHEGIGRGVDLGIVTRIVAPRQQVGRRDVNPQTLQGDFFAEARRELVAQRDLLEPQERSVLEVEVRDAEVLHDVALAQHREVGHVALLAPAAQGIGSQVVRVGEFVPLAAQAVHDLIAVYEIEEYVEREILIREGVSEASAEFRMRVSDDDPVVVIDDAVTGGVVPDHVTALERLAVDGTLDIGTLGAVRSRIDVVRRLRVYAQGLVAEEYARRLSLAGQRVGAHDHILAVGQPGDLVPVEVDVERGVPAELALQVHGVEQELHAPVLHGSEVGRYGREARIGGQREVKQQILALFQVDIGRSQDPSVEEAQVDTCIVLRGGLPAQVVVGQSVV